MKTYLTIIVLLFCTGMISAQVGLDTTTPQATFHINGQPGDLAEADGILIPRLSLSQLDDKMNTTTTYTTDQNGVLVYISDVSVASTETSTENITETGFYYYDHPTWFAVGENKFWSTKGNIGTDATNDFLGTRDEQDLIFRVNDTIAGRIPYGTSNLFLGFEAGLNNTPGVPDTNAGTDNTALGFLALTENTSGRDNTAVGNSALRLNIEGFQNTAMGDAALVNNVIGGNNTALGFQASNENNNGSDNTSIGSRSLQNNTIGNNHTAVGRNALRNMVSGEKNTALGADSFTTSSDYSNSVAIGNNAQVEGNNSIAIGANAEVLTDNKIRLGDNNVRTTDIAGQLSVNSQDNVRMYSFPDNRGTANYALVTNADGTTTWVDPSTFPSDVNLKTNIQGLNGSLEKIMKLRGVTYNWKDKERQDSEIGVIAQEVEKVYPELVVERENGFKAVRYISLTAILIEAVQEQQDIIQQQNQKLDKQDKGIEELKAMVAKQQEQINLLLKKLEK